MRKILSVFFILCLMLTLLAGCGLTNDPEDSSNDDKSQDNTISGDEDTTLDPVDADFSRTDSDMFTDRDLKTDYDASEAVTIQLNGTSATANSDSVIISGSTVMITEEATYLISGELTDGMIVVNAADTAKLQLIFNGVKVTSKTSAALYIIEADKVFVTLTGGTDNALANGGTFEAIDDNNIDAAVFSKQDLTFNGIGSLTVTSPVGHGIVCKDDLVITGGTYTVCAAAHGLDANDSVRITGSTDLTIDAGKDGIHSEHDDDASLGFVYMENGTVSIEAEGDGISAGAYLQLADGALQLRTGGGSENGTKAASESYGGFMGGRPGGFGNSQSSGQEDSVSMKGLKALTGMQLTGGSITADCADDAIHCDASITISGGSFSLASGDDAIHAEDTLTVITGDILITESYEGLEALHIDIQGGNIRLSADDDGLNAAGGTDGSGIGGGRDGMFGGRPGGGMSAGAGTIQISGGNIDICAYGDGIDANGSVQISAGNILVQGPSQGDTSTLDYDTTATIIGGTFIGTGAAGMAQTFSDSQQGVIAVSVGSREAGTRILLQDAAGSVLFDHTPQLSYCVVILSSPELVKGAVYTITVGQQSGSFAAK